MNTLKSVESRKCSSGAYNRVKYANEVSGAQYVWKMIYSLHITKFCSLPCRWAFWNIAKVCVIFRKRTTHKILFYKIWLTQQSLVQLLSFWWTDYLIALNLGSSKISCHEANKTWARSSKLWVFHVSTKYKKTLSVQYGVWSMR